jgi:hypothetical protein
LEPITVVTPTGCIGNRGIHKESFQAVIRDEKPHVVASDAGSLDCGPWYLGAGKPHSPLRNITWDLDLLLSECVPKKIPIIIGSAGGSGAGPHVEFTVNLVHEIARKRGLKFRLAVIPSDVDQTYLAKRAAEETVAGIDGQPALTPEVVKSCSTIVAMMGVEPMIKALEAGADVIIAGRATDNGTIGSYPIWKGADKGLSLHMGDIMECGDTALVEREKFLRGLGPNRIPIIGTIGDGYFQLKAGNSKLVCTPQSAAAHSLYERSSIFSSAQPGGILDTSQTKFEQIDAMTRVTGTRFVTQDPYTVLLEGASRVGYRSVTILGVRNPRMIGQIDQILAQIAEIETQIFGDEGKIQIYWHVYGKNAVLQGREFQKSTAHELGVVADVVAETQALAHQVADDIWLRVSFQRYDGRQTTAGNCGVLFSPNVIDAGEAFDLKIYHPLPLKDPCALHRVDLTEVRY